jgi:pilus assembly protein CpaB
MLSLEMKTNWVPLLVIAVVVAMLATGVFYHLVVSRLDEVEANATARQPVPERSVKPSEVVPPGFRAITIHVYDSGGLFQLLEAGRRVDVQAIFSPPGGLELRTVARNVAVVKLHPPAGASPGRAEPAMVTLLVTPEEADRVALADSAARIRLALRAANDPDASPRPGIGVAALLKPPPEAKPVPAPAPLAKALAASPRLGCPNPAADCNAP